MTLQEFKEAQIKYDELSAKDLLIRLSTWNCKHLLNNDEIKSKVKNILNEAYEDWDKYMYYDDILSKYDISEILNIFDIDYLKYYKDKLLPLFESASSRDINSVVSYVISRDEILNIFNHQLSDFFTCFQQIEYNNLLKFIHKLEEKNMKYDNQFIGSCNFQKELLHEDFNKDTLIWIVKAFDKDNLDYFFTNDKRSVYLYDKFDIKWLVSNKVKFNSQIINQKKFFEKLKSDSIVELRFYLNKLEQANPSSYTIEDTVLEYYNELLNKYNKDTDLFIDYEKILENEQELYDAKSSYLITNNMKEEVYNEELEGDELNKFLKRETNLKISEIVVDGLFHDNIYNVKINLEEIVRFNHFISEDEKLDEQTIEFYKTILNIDSMNNNDKIDLYNKLKNKNISSMYYFDIRKLKDIAYKRFEDELINPTSKKELLDKKATEKYGVPVYNFDDAKYMMLARVSGKFKDKCVYCRNCYTFINNFDNYTKSAKSNGKYEKEGYFLYGYSSFNPNNIMHMLERDSFSTAVEDEAVNNYVNRLATPEQLINRRFYNEVDIKNEKIDDNYYKAIKPDFIITYNEPNEYQVEEAKRLGISIVKIKESNISLEDVNKDFEEFSTTNLKVQYENIACTEDEEKRRKGR